MSASQICNFYDSLHIFVTGGSGFIGKVLVEKLLRSTEVATIYLLIRKKKGKDVALRLQEMLENEPFRKLKTLRPDFRKRIRAIVGDNTFPDLGLSVADKQELISKVNVVFHVAATVRFHENIETAYDTNVGMTAKVIDLCKQMRNLKSFIYVSTAYCNCYLSTIEEMVYENLDINRKQAEAILSQPHGSKKLTAKILQKWPNTYSFTKALAEVLIKETANDLPVGIFRPSIVISTYKEPIEGWTDSLGGPNMLVASISSGFTRFFCCDINLIVDLIPVDMTVAALITSAWDIYQRYKEGTSNIPIYNYVSSVDNPVIYDEFIKLNIMVNTEHWPFNNCLWAPTMTTKKRSPVLSFLLDATYHYFPALLFDIASVLCLKKPSMISKYRKFHISRRHMEYFMLRQWDFKNGNVRDMWKKISDVDRKLFPFDVTEINWVYYFRNYYKGIRCYLFKEPWQNLSKARIKAKTLKIAHHILIFTMYFLGITSLWILLLKIIPRKLRMLALQKVIRDQMINDKNIN